MKNLMVLLAISLMVFAGCKYFGYTSDNVVDEGGVTLLPGNDSLNNPTGEVVASTTTKLDIATTSTTEATTTTEMAEAPNKISADEAKASNLPKLTVKENEKVTLDFSATDPDGDPLTYSFSPPLNDKGEWQTKRGDAGAYKATVMVSDGKSETAKDLIIMVNSINENPVLKQINDVFVKEGDIVTVTPEATDPNGDTISFSIDNANFNKEGNAFIWQTGFEDAGSYKAMVFAKDEYGGVASQSFDITVENVNRKPSVQPVKDITLNEEEVLTFSPVASDPDGDKLKFTYTQPVNADGVWETKRGDAGKYDITITVSDGQLSDSTIVHVTVISINKEPVIEAIPDVVVNEDETVLINVKATDANNDKLTYKIDSDKFKQDENLFTWKTGFNDAGDYEFTVTVSDGYSTVSQGFKVKVNNVNRAPILVIGVK